jgi:hypothetical protein
MLLGVCREDGGFDERGGDDEETWCWVEGRASNKSSTSSKSSSSSSDDPTKVPCRPPRTFFGGDVKARSRASLSSSDGPLIPVIPPEKFLSELCFLDKILNAG